MMPQSQSVSAATPRPAGEIAAAELLATLAQHAGKPLIFSYGGRDALPGYHVTEVKTGAFQALDCGANYESWHETFIQRGHGRAFADIVLAEARQRNGTNLHHAVQLIHCVRPVVP